MVWAVALLTMELISHRLIAEVMGTKEFGV